MERRALLILGLASGALAACGRQPKMAAVPAGATVLALGDSITFGTGTSPDASYPTVLAQLTGWKIVNAGIPGDTSAGALQRLPELMKEHAPPLVLVSIGGNDFLRRMSQAQTRENIRNICLQAASGGAQVLLIAVPELSAVAAVARSLSDHPMYAELAKELKIPVHASGWAEVLSDPTLRSDPIHANAAGYAKFARGVADTARKVGLLAS
jgi:acyl-CoA thioesterase-1